MQLVNENISFPQQLIDLQKIGYQHEGCRDY